MSSTNRGAAREPADNYPTPSWCVRRLLEAVELPPGRWLEPACGESGPRARPMDLAWARGIVGRDPAEWPEDLRVQEWPEVSR
jgi:hypothetical protein